MVSFLLILIFMSSLKLRVEKTQPMVANEKETSDFAIPSVHLFPETSRFVFHSAFKLHILKQLFCPLFKSSALSQRKG